MYNGKVKFFNEAKGFGFIKETETSKEYFVHASGLIDRIKENDEVTFELEEGRKGLNALNAFIKHFSKTRIRYEYDTNALVHIVEVLPNDIYHLDTDYIQWEDDFYKRFVTLFPSENICFISDDALVEISTPELVLEGLEYAPITSSKETTNIINTNIVTSVNKCFDIPFSDIPFYELRINYKFNSFDSPNSCDGDNILKAA
jgi:CspA family cold shock protein